VSFFSKVTELISFSFSLLLIFLALEFEFEYNNPLLLSFIIGKSVLAVDLYLEKEVAVSFIAVF